MAENTIRHEEFVTSAPDIYSLTEDDKFVLHAGGFYRFVVLEPEHVVSAQLPINLTVALYALDKALILWFPGDLGLEIPYQKILLHAVQDDHVYVQMELSEYFRSPTGYVECTFTPVETTPESSDDLLRDSATTEQLYQAMARCLAMNLDSEDEEDDVNTGVLDAPAEENGLQALEIPASWINQGTADDLDEMEVQEDWQGGMDVDIGQGPVAGAVRRRDSENQEVKRKRT